MKKITFHQIATLFVCLSFLPLTAMANLIKNNYDYGVQGIIFFDPNWINQINQEMKQTPGSYLQWVEVQLRDAYSNGKYVQAVVYHKDYNSNQITFPSDSIIIPATRAPSADTYYKVTYMYQIYKIGRNGRTSIQNFSATMPYTDIKVTYPTNF